MSVKAVAVRAPPAAAAGSRRTPLAASRATPEVSPPEARDERFRTRPGVAMTIARRVTGSAEQRPPRAASAGGEGACGTGAGPARRRGRGRSARGAGLARAARRRRRAQLAARTSARPRTRQRAAQAQAARGRNRKRGQGAGPDAEAGRARGGAGAARAAAMGRSGVTAPLPSRRHGRWVPHGGVRGLGGVRRQRGARR